MTTENYIALAIAAFVTVYLVVALLYPEKF